MEVIDMIACMGGWCASRDKCQHYYVHSKVIVERLCGKLEEPELVKPELHSISIKPRDDHASCDVQR